MKRLLLVLVLVSLLYAQESSDDGYKGWAVGGGLSLAVPDDGWGYYGNKNVGPGVELSSLIRFKIGKAGWIQYSPSVNWWGRWDSWGDDSKNTDVDLVDWELNFNVTDVRYAPPVGDEFLLKPYIGFGLIGFSIYYFKEEFGSAAWPHVGDYHNSDTDFAPMQNFFMGTEFDTGSDMWPYVEFKLSNGDVDDFLVTVGFTVQHNK